MASDNPYRTPGFERRKLSFSTLLPRRTAVLGFVGVVAFVGAVAGALVGYAIGAASDEFDKVYFQTPPREVIVAETFVGLFLGLFFGALSGVVIVAIVDWIRTHTTRTGD